MMKFLKFIENKNDKNWIIHSLSVIYPLFVILLAIFPPFIGLFINPTLVVFREIIISLAWIPFLTIPFYLSGKRIFYYIIVILCFINGFINLSHWILINAPLSASSLFVLFNTNLQEATGFAHLRFSFKYLLVIPYLIIFILTLKYPPKIRKHPKKRHYFVIAAIAIFCCSFIVENLIHGRFIRKSTPILVKSIVAFNNDVKAFQQLKQNTKMNLLHVKATDWYPNQPQVYVLILGESTSRNHMSLYGYYRKTNPSLSKFKNLILYDDVISAYSNTLLSVTHSLSQAAIYNNLKPAKCINLTEVFKSAGFKTYWLSNQSPVGVWDNLITLFAQQSDETEFTNLSTSSSFEITYKRAYDGKLFLPLKNALAEKPKHKFIILHLIGCHCSYKMRYPERFSKFDDDSTDKSKTISQYDNAVLYNDFVVDSMLKIVKSYCAKNKVIGTVLYISDHGENVFDEDNYAGHYFSGTIPKCNVEIPFILWCSPKYQKLFPQKIKQFKQNIHLPFETDDLFYAMIDLSNMKTPVFIPSKSIFNKNFNSHRKRILNDGQDYNKKK